MTAADAQRDLEKRASPTRARIVARYFKTGPGQYGAGDRFLGVTLPELRQLEREYSALPLSETKRLLRSPWHEARTLALLILVRQYARGTANRRQAIHRLYLQNTKWINNWDLVDVSAATIVGSHLPRGDRALLRTLAKSRILWERRIAIVATYEYIKHGDYRDTLAVARLLLDDTHDLIHKAVGWMLREVGKRDRSAEEKFLARHAPRMPRTMLRYAVERLPPSLRRKHMEQ
jgi:3-methyladenine DNA glycosylase AlkD